MTNLALTPEWGRTPSITIIISSQQKAALAIGESSPPQFRPNSCGGWYLPVWVHVYMGAGIGGDGGAKIVAPRL
ncbi:unnamed protein product [Protopolystoma xenopodis]|uniref:Uncharacterized protein n=1 Tax=Protopolystoma xenopodis TaxID=117903 RepID=A0A448XLW8_9PLAT|nr:unnamed protein product [Protopolystoma xenopodis]